MSKGNGSIGSLVKAFTGLDGKVERVFTNGEVTHVVFGMRVDETQMVGEKVVELPGTPNIKPGYFVRLDADGLRILDSKAEKEVYFHPTATYINNS